MKKICWLVTFSFLLIFSPVLADEYPKVTISPQMDTVTFEGGKSVIVHTSEDSNERNSVFEKDAEHYGIHIKIVSCELLIDVPAGSAHGDNSYGAVCVIADGKHKIEICDDEMVGHFATNAIFAETKKDLVRFIANNCVGG